MTSSPERRRSRTGACRPTGPSSFGLGILPVPAALLLACVSVLWSSPASAQLALPEAEARYEEAVAANEVNVQARDRAFNLHEQALDRVDAARAARNDQQMENAQAEFQVRAMELMQAEQAARESAARVQAARETYQTALEEREEAIAAELNAGPITGQSDQALVAEWRQVHSRALELEGEAGSDQLPALRPVPELTVDPRDGRDDLLAKENLMEDRAASYDSTVAYMQNAVADLERQQRRNQSMQDLLRDVQRSGPDLVPGAPLLPPTNPEGDADGGDGGSAGAAELALGSLSIDERIELYRGLIQQAQQLRDDARARAGVFRSLAEALGN